MNTPPPPPLTQDHEIDIAAVPVSPTKRFKKSRSLFNLRSKTKGVRSRKSSSATVPDRLKHDRDSSTEEQPYGDLLAQTDPVIPVDDTRAEDDKVEKDLTHDLYRWAILYENQRGITVFSAPHYTSRSLLPSDPAPFTIPMPAKKSLISDPKDAMRTPYTLRDYQLPDARWRWVSNNWMVDMRGDGEVCEAGFEYNWLFRTKGWRPHPGTLNTGGWVRRRRWVRLMMRPAEFPPVSKTTISPPTSHSDTHLSVSHMDMPSSTSSVNTRSGELAKSSSDLSLSAASALASTWRGDPEGDWMRCHRLLKEYRDGKKLELWRKWLGLASRPLTHGVDYVSIKGKGKETLRPDDASAHHWGEVVESPFNPISDSESERSWIVTVLKQHGSEILSSFIFPSSRTRFLELLDEVGIERQVLEDVALSPSNSTLWNQRTEFVKEEEQMAQDRKEQNGTPSKMLSMGGEMKDVSL